MHESLFALLVLAAVSIGSLHSIAPDHWVPFAALGRARRWSAWQTARLTILCGFGHVTASVILGLLGLVFGVELLQHYGQRMESAAGLLLIGFGLAYAAWGIRRAAAAHIHGHAGRQHGDPCGGALAHSAHAYDGVRHHHDQHHDDRDHDNHQHHHHHHFDHEHEGHRLTPWTLFLLFSADPCVAVIPLLFAAAPLGVTRTIAVVAAYEAATIGAMVALVLPAQVAARRVRGAWVDRFGDAAAGGIIACVGAAVTALGW
jgi:nickel/cobalt transporter (NicO) family protein